MFYTGIADMVSDFPQQRGDVMKQIVFLDKTRSGRLGYFTNGILAWHLTPEEFDQPTEWHIANASQLGFEFCVEEQV